jgi:hypothetical protein
MAINKKLIHFNNFSTFNSQKLSANANNDQYTEGINGEIKSGSPDILYQSICWIKDTQQQWTHGQLYDGTNSSVTESTINNWGFLSGEETSEELDDIETNTYIKYVVQTLTETQKQQTRDNIGAASTEYVLSLFNELKEMILSGGGGGVVIPNAILDSAILNNSKLV